MSYVLSTTRYRERNKETEEEIEEEMILRKPMVIVIAESEKI